jgi:serine/threonine protein kinase
MQLRIKSKLIPDRHYIIERKNLMEPLGKGSFGLVVKCKCENDGIEYAAKRMDLNKPNFPVEVFTYETANAKAVRDCINKNPTVESKLANCLDECEEKTDTSNLYYLIYSLYDSKDLRQYVKQVGCIPESDAWEMIRQIYSGLHFLHNKAGIVHRDVKLDNIFLSSIGPKDIVHSPFKCYVGDLGLSKQEDSVETDCGTRETKAPEVETGKYDRKADFYSLGAIFYQMLFGGAAPFKLFGNMASTVMAVGIYYINKAQRISDLAVAFIESCMQKDPAERISEEELVKFLKIDRLDIPFYVPPSLKNIFTTPTKRIIEECCFHKGKKHFPSPLMLYEDHMKLLSDLKTIKDEKDITDVYNDKDKSLSFAVATCLSASGEFKSKLSDEWQQVDQ